MICPKASDSGSRNAASLARHNFQGIVTNADILEAIVGDFRTDEGPVEPDAVRREDGSWLIAGKMPADEMADRLAITVPQERSYHTAAGFVLNQLGHLPAGELAAADWLTDPTWVRCARRADRCNDR